MKGCNFCSNALVIKQITPYFCAEVRAVPVSFGSQRSCTNGWVPHSLTNHFDMYRASMGGVSSQKIAVAHVSMLCSLNKLCHIYLLRRLYNCAGFDAVHFHRELKNRSYETRDTTPPLPQYWFDQTVAKIVAVYTFCKKLWRFFFLLV